MLVFYFWIKPRHYTAHYPSVLPQSSGYICLSILDEDDGWRPAITIKQVLIGIQELLDDPNDKSPAQRDAYELFVKDKPAYRKKIKEQAVKNLPSNWRRKQSTYRDELYRHLLNTFCAPELPEARIMYAIFK